MLPHALLLAAVVLWGWTFVATKILLSEIEPLAVFALRLAIGVPVVGLMLLVQRVPLRVERADVGAMLLGGGILTIHFFLQAFGLLTTTATNTGWIIAVTPLVLAAASRVVLGERLSRAGVAGIAIATAGIIVLVSRGRVADLAWLRSTGDWLVLASTLTWAAYTVTTRDLVRRRPPLAITFWILVVAAALMLIVMPLLRAVPDPRTLSGRGLAALAYLGVAGLAVGQWFWQEGVARLGATRAGLYLYLEPLATVALAVPLLGEPFGGTTIAGGLLVLGGVYLGQRRGS